MMASLQVPSISDLPIYNTLMSNRLSVLLSVAVKLHIFDYIKKSSQVCANDVASHYQFSLRGSDALLVGLFSLELLQKTSKNIETDWYSINYTLSPLAETYLLSDSEFYFGHLIEMDCESFLTPDKLLKTLKNDAPNVYGDNDPWEHQDSTGNEELSERFTLGMKSISIAPAVALSTSKVFKGRKVLLDVGGGSGVHLAKLLLANDALNGILLDIPSVFKTAEPYLKQEQVLHRIDFVATDMFKSTWPRLHSNGQQVDVIFLSQMLHDWPIEKGFALLKKAWDTLAPNGVVVIHEKLLNAERSGPLMTAMVSIDMLFWTHGQQYTQAKLFEMLTSIGFKELQNQPTTGYWSLTCGYKPSA